MLPQYQIAQSQFQSPPVLYSQSQPMMVSNQNNMSYQMVNLGAGAIAQRMQQRQQEEHLIDLLTKQSALIANLADIMDWRIQKKQQEDELELEELEKKNIILRQKKAESDYLYKLNRQLNFGLQRIHDQQISQLQYPKPHALMMKVPSIAAVEEQEEVYPNARYRKQIYVSMQYIQSGENPNDQQYQPQFNMRQSQERRSSQISQNVLPRPFPPRASNASYASQQNLSQKSQLMQSKRNLDSQKSGRSITSKKSKYSMDSPLEPPGN